jgi:hypothetical protein
MLRGTGTRTEKRRRQRKTSRPPTSGRTSPRRRASRRMSAAAVPSNTLMRRCVLRAQDQSISRSPSTATIPMSPSTGRTGSGAAGPSPMPPGTTAGGSARGGPPGPTRRAQSRPTAPTARPRMRIGSKPVAWQPRPPQEVPRPSDIRAHPPRQCRDLRDPFESRACLRPPEGLDADGDPHDRTGMWACGDHLANMTRWRGLDSHTAPTGEDRRSIRRNQHGTGQEPYAQTASLSFSGPQRPYRAVSEASRFRPLGAGGRDDPAAPTSRGRSTGTADAGSDAS